MTIRVKKKLACLEDQLKIPFEDLNIELKKPGIFRESDVFNFAEIDASHSLSPFINHNHFSIINNAAFQVPVQPIPSGINQIELLEKFRAVAEFFPAFILYIVFSYELSWIHFYYLPRIASPAHNLLGLRKKTKQLNSSLSTRSLMRPENPFRNMLIGQLFETLLPDFVLAFTFFTAISYMTLSKRFGRQRPAIAVSATVGFALSVGLVWWEEANKFSIRDLGPVAIGFAVIVLALVIYHSIRQIGGSWAGAGIALGVTIIIARLLELNVPIDPEIIQIITMVALIVGILALASYTRGHSAYSQRVPARLPQVRHDMTDLYRGQKLSNKLTKKMKKLRRETEQIDEHPQEANNILPQLKRMLPAEGYLTEKMAQLRAKAHQIRNGHIARLEETRQVFAGLPTSAKKKASAELAARYKQIIGIDARLERLDKSVAENERRIIELTRNAQQYARRYDHRQLAGCLKAAEKLQHHNSRLLKLIQHTESKLSAVAKKVAQETREVNKK